MMGSMEGHLNDGVVLAAVVAAGGVGGTAKTTRVAGGGTTGGTTATPATCGTTVRVPGMCTRHDGSHDQPSSMVCALRVQCFSLWTRRGRASQEARI